MTKHLAVWLDQEPTLEPKIVGIESITGASDGSFLRYAQQHFKLSNPMRRP